MDKEQYLAVNVTTVDPTAKVKTYLRTGTGSEGKLRLPTSHNHDYKMTAEPSEPTSVFRLDRAIWRKKMGRKDEGEWTGPWGMCIVAGGEHSHSETVMVEAFVELAVCPMGPSYRECGGRGECVIGHRPCPAPLEDHECRADVCACLPGLNPPDCTTGTLLAP
eukprot:CAMPEP_0197851090 /NCGR_PEP_ID=MMETSP1438-20131217/17234_1 /TAXON_ID=1461541 /ORGANISM="Pterosperma sp., Strain CCMP1384" /LENGTH=162 /DNA_ID=CAMNT_0043464567 /DNA_START=510 /DNA_END=994 /DNA_ORIENTATION=+